MRKISFQGFAGFAFTWANCCGSAGENDCVMVPSCKVLALRAWGRRRVSPDKITLARGGALNKSSAAIGRPTRHLSTRLRYAILLRWFCEADEHECGNCASSERCMMPIADYSMALPLNKQTAVITGAGSAEAIGFAVALRLRAAGVRVVITSTTDGIQTRLRRLDEGGE